MYIDTVRFPFKPQVELPGLACVITHDPELTVVAQNTNKVCMKLSEAAKSRKRSIPFFGMLSAVFSNPTKAALPSDPSCTTALMKARENGLLDRRSRWSS